MELDGTHQEFNDEVVEPREPVTGEVAVGHTVFTQLSKSSGFQGLPRRMGSAIYSSQKRRLPIFLV